MTIGNDPFSTIAPFPRNYFFLTLLRTYTFDTHVRLCIRGLRNVSFLKNIGIDEKYVITSILQLLNTKHMLQENITDYD